MPKGVYVRNKRKMTKNEVKEFLEFIDKDEFKELLAKSNKPHILAANLYKQHTNKTISPSTVKRNMSKYQIIHDEHGAYMVAKNKEVNIKDGENIKSKTELINNEVNEVNEEDKLLLNELKNRVDELIKMNDENNLNN